MKTIKYLTFVGLALIMTLSLVATSCAPAAPTGEEGAEEVARLEGDLAASEKKVSSLEKEIAALKKPAKVFKWRVGNLYPRGTSMQPVFDKLADDVDMLSNGRLTMEWQMSGEGVGATELLSAASSGLLEGSWIWPALHTGEIPATAVEMGLPGSPLNYWELITLYDRAGWKKELRRIYSEHNVYWVDTVVDVGAYVISTEPINSIDDFAKMKFRSGGSYAIMAEKLGASTVVMGFGEAYTSLATGVIDGVMMSTRIDHRDGKWYEVAKWWYPLPVVNYQSGPMIINMDAWNSLSDDLKGIFEFAVAVDITRGFSTQQKYNEAAAIEEQMAAGVQYSAQPSAADLEVWNAAAAETWDEIAAKDADSAKLIRILRELMKGLGY